MLTAVFANDLTRWENDLKNHYGVEAGRIQKANNGNAATSADLDAAIKAVCDLVPKCSKIYVRLTSHGYDGKTPGIPKGFALKDKIISPEELCKKFRKLSEKGVPICLIINGCHTGGLLDKQNWNFPAPATATVPRQGASSASC